MSLETDIKDKFVGWSLGTFEADSGWSIHIGKMPDTPHMAIVITHSGGPPPDPKWLIDYPNVQVRVRGAPGDWSATRLKIQEIKDRMLGLPSETQLGGDRWAAINLLSDIAPIGYDNNHRPEFTVNFSMIIHPAAPAQGNRAVLPP